MDKEAKTKTPKYLLVSSSPYFDLDKLGSVVVLGKLLAQTESARVDIFLNVLRMPKELSEVIIPTDVTFVEKLSSDYFTLTLDRGDAKISEVRWEEKEDKVRILIFTDRGKVDTKEYTTEPGRPHYDAVYSVGIRTEEKLLQTLGEFKGLWKATNSFNLDNTTANKRFGQNNFVHPDVSTYAQLIMDFAAKHEYSIPADVATELLSLIYWKTNSLRNKYARPELFSAVQELLNAGASVETAAAKIFSSLSFAEVKAAQEIMNNLKQTQDGLIISRVSKETATSLKTVNPVNPNKNPLVVAKTAKASFAMVPMANDATLVLCSAPKFPIRLKQIFSNYSYLGDNFQGEFTVKGDITSTEQIIKDTMSKHLTKNTSEKQKRDSKDSKEPIKDVNPDTRSTSNGPLPAAE